VGIAGNEHLPDAQSAALRTLRLNVSGWLQAAVGYWLDGPTSTLPKQTWVSFGNRVIVLFPEKAVCNVPDRANL
jgi:hypothetical protein